MDIEKIRQDLVRLKMEGELRGDWRVEDRPQDNDNLMPYQFRCSYEKMDDDGGEGEVLVFFGYGLIETAPPHWQFAFLVDGVQDDFYTSHQPYGIGFGQALGEAEGFMFYPD
jgi:hypothetical protein